MLGPLGHLCYVVATQSVLLLSVPACSRGDLSTFASDNRGNGVAKFLVSNMTAHHKIHQVIVELVLKLLMWRLQVIGFQS